jgi:hypothetical protein
MAKEPKPADQRSEVAEQAMEQARGTADVYFEYLKKAIAVTPSGGNEFAEKLKGYAEKNITMTLFTAAEPSAEFPGYGSHSERFHAVADESGGRTNK